LHSCLTAEDFPTPGGPHKKGTISVFNTESRIFLRSAMVTGCELSIDKIGNINKKVIPISWFRPEISYFIFFNGKLSLFSTACPPDFFRFKNTYIFCLKKTFFRAYYSMLFRYRTHNNRKRIKSI